MSNKSKNVDSYIDLKNNGRIFPSWVLHNFKSSKLPEIFRKENEDPCNIETKIQLRKYQEFIGKYLGPKTPYNEILLYHGLGSGKTATSINVMNVFYNYDSNINFVLLIKASLRDDPWMKDLKRWLGRNPDELDVENVTKLARYSTLHFVHYDSPYADRDFLETMKKIDTTKPIMYIIDEVHNFIRNVYSNINSTSGRRAKVIYEYILKDKKENKDTKIILISATPIVNIPFELSLIFNLLRPGIFPSSEAEFNRTFVTKSAYPVLNPARKNLFQRRILGLVSYYTGATSDLYAEQSLEYVNLVMSPYQYDIYRIFEKLENEIQKKAQRFGKVSQLYRTYTRQASNFVFPRVNGQVNGELRPRPGKFRVSDKDADALEKGKKVNLDEKNKESKKMLEKYQEALITFVRETELYFREQHKADVKDGHTIYDDLEKFKNGFTEKYNEKFINFYENSEKKSGLFNLLYDCGPKMLAVVFMSYISPGKVMVYTNYVIMEGIDMLKVYFRMIGFDDYTTAKEFKGFCEYHGRIDPLDRVKVKNMFITKDNTYGSKCKVILLSPSATEGIQLLDIRQEHILEPYWTDVRIQQVIGRGIRQCSHKNLPMNQRNVKIYRYKIIKPTVLDPDDNMRVSTDEYIDDGAKAKANLNESFLMPMKEVAVDCELFKAHNMVSQSYQCFNFPEDIFKNQNIGPAYKEDIKEDIKYDSGLHAKNSTVVKIKVIKVKVVYKLNPDGGENKSNYSIPEYYWYYPKTGMVYDFDTHYPVGQVEYVNGIPSKFDKDTYIMDNLIKIPSIDTTVNP